LLASWGHERASSAFCTRRADLEARDIIRRRGRRLKKVPLPQAEIEEPKAVEVCDKWCWLLGEVRLALEPLTPTHRIVSVAETKVTTETALDLLKELAHPDIIAFAEDLEEKMPELPV
jgi:hypothetical protein